MLVKLSVRRFAASKLRKIRNHFLRPIQSKVRFSIQILQSNHIVFVVRKVSFRYQSCQILTDLSAYLVLATLELLPNVAMNIPGFGDILVTVLIPQMIVSAAKRCVVSPARIAHLFLASAEGDAVACPASSLAMFKYSDQSKLITG